MGTLPRPRLATPTAVCPAVTPTWTPTEFFSRSSTSPMPLDSVWLTLVSPWPPSTTVLPPPSTPSSLSLPWTPLRLLRPRPPSLRPTPPRRPLSLLSLRGRRGRLSPHLPTDLPPITLWFTPLTTATPMPMPALATTATDSPTTDEQ